MRRITLIVSLAIGLFPVAAHARRSAIAPAGRADSLVAEARKRHDEGSFGQRRIAIRLLEEAAALEPTRSSIQQALGRAYLDAGFHHRARLAFEAAAKADRRNPEAWFGLAQLYKRNWLRSLGEQDLERAIANAQATLRLEPAHGEAAVMLAVLRIERGEAAVARQVVAEAHAAGCDAPELGLAAAYLAYRSGDAARAESVLAAVRPRLSREVSARFDDVLPMLGSVEAEMLVELGGRARAEYAQRFWRESDPDPTTSLNEAVVEYHARVAHALLVFTDSWNPRWDMRAALYVRYGAPARVLFLPVGTRDSYQTNPREVFWNDPQGGPSRRISEHLEIPMNVQLWDYPQLGMRVELRDMVLSQNYEMPRTDSVEVEARVDVAVAEANGLMPANAGRAAFSTLLPGVKRLEVSGRVARFLGEDGPHLLAQFEMPGSAADTLAGECVVLDSTGREIARGSARPDPSRCDPASRRTLQFAFALPAGHYRMAFAANDRRGGRGVTHRTLSVPAPVGGLTLSDVVPVCGGYEPNAGRGPVRLSPNVDARFDGDSRLNAYFEVYGLGTDANGLSRFDLDYEVFPLKAEAAPWYRRLFGARPHARISVRSEESSPGAVRRQFVQVPIASLAAGGYRLDVTVHDSIGGTSVTQSLEFVR